MRDGLLNGEIFDIICEFKALINIWMAYYNTIRLHNALQYRPPEQEFEVVNISLKMIQILI